MSGGGIAAIVALCLVVSMISGIVTGAFIGRRNTPSDAITPTDSGSSSTVTPNETTSGHESTATTSPVPLIQQAASSGNTLSPEEIAANCTDSVVVVEVVTVTTYTMFGKNMSRLRAAREAASSTARTAMLSQITMLQAKHAAVSPSRQTTARHTMRSLS